MKFDRNFEEDILSRCLRDQTYLKKAAGVLDAHHFGSKQHAWIWEMVKGIWDKYREQPNGKLIIAHAKAAFKDEDEYKVHLELVNKISKRKPKAALATLEQMSRFVRAVNAQIILEQSAKELEKGNIEKCWEGLSKAAKKDVTPRDYKRTKWIEGFMERQLERKYEKEHPGTITRIPTGFKQLDHIIGGGIQLGEFGLVMATTGKGKSVTLNNLAFWAAASGYPTAYFMLEMPGKQINQRLDSRWLQLEYNKLKAFELLPSELREVDKKYKREHKRFGNMLEVIEMPLRKCTVESIYSTLGDMEDDGFKPKLIIVDSGDHMSAMRRYESYRLEQAEVYWGLSGLALEGYAVWSSTQAGKEWAKAVATAEATSESYDKARIASIVLSLNTPEKKTRSTKSRIATDDDDDDDEEKKPGEGSTLRDTVAVIGKYIELYLAKNRDGESGVTIPLDAQFERMFIKEADEV